MKLKIILLVLLLSFLALGQTSTYVKYFMKADGTALTGYTGYIYFVPQANTYPTGALSMTEDGTRLGQYYRNNVPVGEYKIYIDADKSGAGAPALYLEHQWIGEDVLTRIAGKFDVNTQIDPTAIKDNSITHSKLNIGNSIVNADVNSAAAIAYSKLNLAGAIKSTDLQTIPYSKLSLTGMIQPTDLQTIPYSKLSLSGSIQPADLQTIPYSKLNLGSSIVLGDINPALKTYIDTRVGGGTINNLPDGVTIKQNLDSTLSVDTTEILSYAKFQADSVAKLNILDSLGKDRSFINVKRFGANGDSLTNCTPLIQAAIDLAISSGGGTVFVPKSNKPYLLKKQGNCPYNTSYGYCLDLKSGNISLYIEAGAILQLADSQAVGLRPINIIVFQNANNIFIGGGGMINGNTAGQKTFSLGYAQLDDGCAIWGYPPGNYFTLDNLIIKDLFSNPIWLNLYNYVTINNLHVSAIGEGANFGSCKNINITNYSNNDSANVAVGDGLELATCQYFNVNNILIAKNGAGGGIDLYGSKDGILSTFVIDSWVDGLQLGNPVGDTLKNVIISNGLIKNVAAIGIDEIRGGVIINNVKILNAGTYGFQDYGLPDNWRGYPFVFNNVTIDSCGWDAVHITSGRTIYFNNCIFTNNGYSAIDLERVNTDGSLPPDVYISGGTFYNNARGDLFLNSQLDTAWYPTGSILGASFDTALSISLGNYGYYSIAKNLYIQNCKLSNSTTIGDTSNAAKLNTLTLNGQTIGTLLNGSKRQKIEIDFSGNSTVNDKSKSGYGNINLDGGACASFVNGDKLFLEFNNNQWYETRRTPNVRKHYIGDLYNQLILDSLKIGTLITPPSNLNYGEVWMDTTDSFSYPILRIKKPLLPGNNLITSWNNSGSYPWDTFASNGDSLITLIKTNTTNLSSTFSNDIDVTAGDSIMITIKGFVQNSGATLDMYISTSDLGISIATIYPNLNINNPDINGNVIRYAKINSSIGSAKIGFMLNTSQIGNYTAKDILFQKLK